MTEIKLNETEKHLCEWVGVERARVNISNKIPDTKEIKVEDTFNTVVSYGAELAVARFFNIYPDFSLVPSPGISHDLVLPTGLRVDVKWVSKPTYGLLYQKDSDINTTDAFILVAGYFPRFTIKGWAYTTELFRQSNLAKMFRTSVYKLSQDQLRSIQTILSAPITQR